MSERRRLKAGVEVQVDGDSVWLHVGPGAVIAFTVPRKYGGADLITEPIPEEPAGPQVGDEVTAEWLASEFRQVERWEEPEPTEPPLDVRMDCAEEFASDLERTLTVLEVRLNALEDRIGALERGERRLAVRIVPGVTQDIALDVDDVRLASDNPNPKEVMPDAGGSLTDDDPARDVAPPPGAEPDVPGGDEPSVEDVLEWLERGVPARWPYDEDATDAAARIIRERGEEIERLTERLTITDGKIQEAAMVSWDVWRRAFDARGGLPEVHWTKALRAALCAAGMIDPEAGSELLTPRNVATKGDVQRVAEAIYAGRTWQKLDTDQIYREMARRALIAMGYEIEEGA